MLTFEQFMAKTAEYISVVQPQNDELKAKVASLTSELASANEKVASADGKSEAFVKRASQAAEVLSSRGLLEKSEVGPFVDKIAEDHSNVWELVEKLAGAIHADNLGDKSQEKLESATSGDPWYDAYFGNSGSQVY